MAISQSHEEGSCFELIGYPDGWVARRSSRGRGRGGRGGRSTGGRGRGTGAAYTVQTALEEPRQTNADGGRATIPGISAEQLQKLLTLIETPKAGNEKLSGNLSSSALVSFNFVINTPVFSNSNPFVRLINFNYACMMHLINVAEDGAVFCKHHGVQTCDAIFILRQVKELILQSLKPQKSPAVQKDSSQIVLQESVFICLKVALDHLVLCSWALADSAIWKLSWSVATFPGYSLCALWWHYLLQCTNHYQQRHHFSISWMACTKLPGDINDGFSTIGSLDDQIRTGIETGAARPQAPTVTNYDVRYAVVYLKMLANIQAKDGADIGPGVIVSMPVASTQDLRKAPRSLCLAGISVNIPNLRHEPMTDLCNPVLAGHVRTFKISLNSYRFYKSVKTVKAENLKLEQGRREHWPPLPQIVTYALPLWEDVRQAHLLSAMEATYLGHEPS
ncbi:hypothetical protein Cgig2_011644 [Carnegiea gigantea]|uniref:Uncharacterized protein n=1 Tax=Carnegiea gigantea TaxID=171969 RepID=A0A9Q1QI64_9CARY|nr:hypothetical protein Cgig2_011644 [Carnegiea gigantea]